MITVFKNRICDVLVIAVDVYRHYFASRYTYRGVSIPRLNKFWGGFNLWPVG